LDCGGERRFALYDQTSGCVAVYLREDSRSAPIACCCADYYYVVVLNGVLELLYRFVVLT
jgi:hypothetical protein